MRKKPVTGLDAIVSMLKNSPTGFTTLRVADTIVVTAEDDPGFKALIDRDTDERLQVSIRNGSRASTAESLTRVLVQSGVYTSAPFSAMATMVRRQVDRLIKVEIHLRGRPTNITNPADEVLDIRRCLDKSVGGRRQKAATA